MPHLGLRDVPEEFELGGDFPEKIIAKCISCSRTQGRASRAALLRLPGHLQNLAVWSHVIDYYESSGHGLPHYVEWLEPHGYCGGVDWWPHDGRVQEFGSGRTRAEIMMSLGRNPRIVPAHKLMDGISAARQTDPLAYFDAARCAKGLECLREYKAEWDDELRTFKKSPLHNWASHGADAFRYLSMAWREPMSELEKPDPIAELLRPRTLNEMMKQYIDEQLELGNEEPGDWLEFK
jgi:phage terminase large subunit